MRLITGVKISDFRSIQAAALNIAAGYLPIVGQNNSGKSNILRALHLFFTGAVEPGSELSLSRDFHNPVRRHRREISVEVAFELPDYFRFHKSIREGLDQTLGRSFSIKKSWSYARQESPDEIALRVSVRKDGEALRPVEGEESHRVSQFLKLVNFRYQPNHTHPSDILKQEEAELQRALLYYLRRKRDLDAADVERIFDRMKEVASDLVKPIGDRLRETSSYIQDLELATPKEFGELLFTFVPRLSVSGGSHLEALQHGSGVQSFLTFLVLAFLDSRFEMNFDWKQATVWCLEEPESFLHQSLQHSVADFLSVQGEGERFQVLTTTHSDVFVRYGAEGVLCSLRNGRTEWRELRSRVLVGEAAKTGVSPYVHPLLYAAQRPLLLVEGETDKRYLALAFRLLGRLNPWAILDVKSVDPDSDLSGIDGLRSYLAANRSALRTRALHSPVFVLVDWNESARKIEHLRQELARHPTSRVLQWRDAELNPELDQSFRGIERSISTELLRVAEERGVVALRRPTGTPLPLSLAPDSLRKINLVELAEQREEPNDFVFFGGLIQRLEEELRTSFEAADRLMTGELFPAGRRE